MSWLRQLLFRNRLRAELDEEIRQHSAERTEALIAAGMEPEEAARQTRRAMGNVALSAERSVEVWQWRRLESLWADVVYAIRQLRKSPGFAITAVLTIAIGVGANLAIFQLLYGVMFAHLPVEKPEQIYSIRVLKSPFDGQWFFSYRAYQRLREATEGAVPVLARSGVGEGVLQQVNGSTSRIDFQLVSDNFFPTLGLSPVGGRFFEIGDDTKERSEYPVILRYAYFKQHFGSDRTVLGRRATLNGVPVVVIGIAPEGFNGVMQGMAPDMWLPLAAKSTGRFGTWFDSLGPGYGVNLDKSYMDQPNIFWLWTLARVPAGAEAKAAARWMPALAPDIAMMAAASKDPHVRAEVLGSHVQLVSARNGEGNLQKRYFLPLMILMAMASLTLLVGCMNLANLQMARLVQREREIAIRIALGASMARVLCQIATESALLAVLGAPLAFATARVSSALLLHWASGRGQEIPIDLHMGAIAYLLGVAALGGTLVCFGLIPAWLYTHKSFSEAVKSRVGSVASQSKAGQRWSNVLLAAQVSLSLLLVCAAVLFRQTLLNLAHVDAGMDREHLLSVHLDMRSTGFADRQKNLSAFYSELLERLHALPGVLDAAVQMCTIPNCGWDTAIHVYGDPELAEAQMHGEEDHVGLGYFRTVGIPLLQGRDFSAGDNEHSQRVAILNHAYAHKLFGDASPIGHWVGYHEDHDFLIVGEVGDTLADGLRSDAPAMLYMSLNQSPQPIGTIVVRSRGSFDTLPGEIRDTLYKLDPALPITEIVPLDVEFHDGLSTEELLARLTGVFGTLTLALAALGFYGLLSFRLERRTSEIGIRMALGATRTQVRALFLRQTLAILLGGAVPGAALALGMGYLARKLMYGTGRMELSALASSLCVLAAVGVLATLVPAHRAASIDPARSLRND